MRHFFQNLAILTYTDDLLLYDKDQLDDLSYLENTGFEIAAEDVTEMPVSFSNIAACYFVYILSLCWYLLAEERSMIPFCFFMLLWDSWIRCNKLGKQHTCIKCCI